MGQLWEQPAKCGSDGSSRPQEWPRRRIELGTFTVARDSPPGTVEDVDARVARLRAARRAVFRDPRVVIVGLVYGIVGLTYIVQAIFMYSYALAADIDAHVAGALAAFMGMLGQIPLIYLTNVLDKKLKGSQIGNVIFWLSFCFVGQPLCVLLYSMQFVDSPNLAP